MIVCYFSIICFETIVSKKLQERNGKQRIKLNITFWRWKQWRLVLKKMGGGRKQT